MSEMSNTKKFEEYNQKYHLWLQKKLTDPIFLSAIQKSWFEEDDFVMFYYQSGSSADKKDSQGKNVLKYMTFSNFEKVPHFPADLLGEEFKGIKTLSSEHVYQAAKFSKYNPVYAKKILSCSTPHEVTKLGRNRNIKGYDPDWEAKKFYVMLDIIRIKAQVCQKYREELLSTKDKILIENTNNARMGDPVWGCGKDGKGSNYLGIGLMILRDEIK
jgi:ribA/ribD-fused uncharacterized protein